MKKLCLYAVYALVIYSLAAQLLEAGERTIYSAHDRVTLAEKAAR